MAIALSWPNAKSVSPTEKSTGVSFFWLWSLWLLMATWAPDIDYIWPAVHPGAHNGLRITHSLTFSLILPGVTGAWLFLRSKSRRPHPIPTRRLMAQVILASLSHLILDGLVGVTPLPLLYPWHTDLFKLPFGVLPSAGKIDVTNYYFYRNLYLELGVLLPCICGWRLYLWTPTPRRRSLTIMKWIAIAICAVLASSFVHQAYGLPRP